VAAFGEADFELELAKWLKEALTDPDAEIEQALAQVSCRKLATAGPLLPDVLGVQFGEAFVEGLMMAPESTWRAKLLVSLVNAEQNREVLDRRLRRTRVALGPPAIGGVVAVSATIANATDHQTLVAALAAAGLTIPVEVAAAWLRQSRRSGPMSYAVFEAAGDWIDDFRFLLVSSTSDGRTLAWISDLRDAGVPLKPPDHLLERLVSLSRAADGQGEANLSTQLFTLEQSLRRLVSRPLLRLEALKHLEALARNVAETLAQADGAESGPGAT
jgi:hypothetical protein